MSDKQQQLLYQHEIKRVRYGRAFVRQVLGGAAAAGAYWALNEAGMRQLADATLLDVGKLAAVLLGGLLAIRAGVFLLYLLTRRNESLKFYTRGFVWTRGDHTFKYPYQELVRYCEAWHGVYLRERPLLQWGANTLTMRDGKVFKVKPRHGNMKKFARLFRPYAAYVTGIRMGQALRKGDTVKVHPKLTIYSGGVEVGNREIHWGGMAVLRRGGRIILQTYDEKRRRYRTVKKLRVSKMVNAGGFYDLAQGTIRNHKQRTNA